NAYLEFVRQQADARIAAHPAVSGMDEWTARRSGIRAALTRAWGAWPEPPPLEPRILGSFDRDGYRVEKLVFQTLPGVWMTANAYVPARPGPMPAILQVHGHWPGAKQDPVVQARCIGAARQGYFVLSVDAFGAGERAIGTALGEYHGEMTAATLFPVGLPLSGLQVYENGRALDYLATRREVDPAHIGITGASGGGNQTMYAAAWDERFRAAAPVCSVGNYRAYLGAACCMCEVVPGILNTTEEGGVLGLIAPRGLLVISATRDAVQFSVEEAHKSIAYAEPVFKLYDAADHLRHTTFDSGHDYSQPMREAMYGWMARFLNGSGDGSPLPEPPTETEPPESLRCFPGDSRPADWVTLPQFAAREARRLLTQKNAPEAIYALRRDRAAIGQRLMNDVLGGFPPGCALDARIEPATGDTSHTLRFRSEPGIDLAAYGASFTSSRIALVLNLEGSEAATKSDEATALRNAGWEVVTIDLRATGALAYSNDAIGGAPDHNTAEWALWLGRPLLGQWTYDVRRAIDALTETTGNAPAQLAVVGLGPAGMVALCAAALDTRITSVAAVNTLASFVTEMPYRNQRLGILAPGIIPAVGDVAHLVALIAPRRVVIAGGVRGDGSPLDAATLRATYATPTTVWRDLGLPAELVLLEQPDGAAIASALG
ncbi:MAG: acetylxylan esterase, partial [Candidatus Hydrogenedentes bacterium]|nr:acetylxylan esterase [Candidatus Hydrogenedentota bacterium]